MIAKPMLAGLLVAAGMLAAAPVLAASGGMPQLNPNDFAPQLVWLLITFLALYLVLAKAVLPKIGSVLEARAERIKGDLDRAAALKAETDKIIAAYEKALADARNNAAAVSRDTAAALAKVSTDRQTEVGVALAARIKTAEASIATARGKAMTEIQAVAAEIAADAAKRLVGLTISPAEAAPAVAAAAKERG
jgi:F-type H+-transporting ATPase subunit b